MPMADGEWRMANGAKPGKGGVRSCLLPRLRARFGRGLDRSTENRWGQTPLMPCLLQLDFDEAELETVGVDDVVRDTFGTRV